MLGLVDDPIAVIPGFIAVYFTTRYTLTRDQHAVMQEKLHTMHREEHEAEQEEAKKTQ